ncbi:MAG: hypothetical protein K6E97_03645 [Treponema sp.]|nr:hypothetical protein [Treponema sp.]
MKLEDNAPSIVDAEKKTIEDETLVTEEKTTEPEKEVVEEKPVETKPEKSVTENKPKTLGKSVVIKCEGLAGRKLSLPTRTVDFDADGKCEVTGEEAERLLSIPGYELVK